MKGPKHYRSHINAESQHNYQVTHPRLLGRENRFKQTTNEHENQHLNDKNKPMQLIKLMDMLKGQRKKYTAKVITRLRKSTTKTTLKRQVVQVLHENILSENENINGRPLSQSGNKRITN